MPVIINTTRFESIVQDLLGFNRTDVEYVDLIKALTASHFFMPGYRHRSDRDIADVLEIPLSYMDEIAQAYSSECSKQLGLNVVDYESLTCAFIIPTKLSTILLVHLPCESAPPSPQTKTL